MPDVLTHSRARCFRSCPRKCYLRYELGIVQEEQDFPLRVGSAFARCVEAHAKGLNVEEAMGDGLADAYDLAAVAAMFQGHVDRWGAPLEHVAAELPFTLPLVNPDTGRPTPTWVLRGKIDRIVRLRNGQLALMEYKTTTRDFAPGADYWLSLHMDYQLSIYVIAARALGYDISRVLYDVTRRPQQRPLKATPAAERRYTEKASKLKDGTVRPAGSLHANQRETDETPEEFAARVAEAMHADPDKHFARIEIARLDQDLEECKAEIWQQGLAIREAQKRNRWYRNPEACTSAAGSKCEYLPICQLRDLEHNTPAGFTRLNDVHPELAVATDGGQPVTARSGLADHVSGV